MDNRAYFYFLKCEARKRTINALNARICSAEDRRRWSGLTLCSILGDQIGDALEFAETRWLEHYSDTDYLTYPKGWRTLTHNHSHAPDHFDLAVWQDIDGEKVLVALALGNPSYARTHLTLKWVERYSGYSHLAGRALIPILTCVEIYAKLLGSQRVLIKCPVDDEKYTRYGYVPYWHQDVPYGGHYLSRELNDE